MALAQPRIPIIGADVTDRAAGGPDAPRRPPRSAGGADDTAQCVEMLIADIDGGARGPL